MYADRKKSEKVYIESTCVSRDDCCWDETPETLEVVAVNNRSIKNEPVTVKNYSLIV